MANQAKHSESANIKYISAVFRVNLEELTNMYRENHLEESQNLPDTETMLMSEFEWLHQSGISLSGAIEEVFEYLANIITSYKHTTILMAV